MKFEIYTKPNCRYCRMAKKLLEMEDFSYEEKDISSDTSIREELLERNPEARLVPQIFCDGELIGGYDELITYLAYLDT